MPQKNVSRTKERVIKLKPTVVQISFSELPTLQKHLYLSHAMLRERGTDAWTVGSSNIGVDIELDKHNITVDTPSDPKPSAISLQQAFATLKGVALQLEEIDPRIVHFVSKHTWNYLLLRRLRHMLPRTVFLHTFHDPIGHDGDSVQRGVVLYHKVIQRLLDGIIVLSDVARRQTEEILRPRCPVHQIPFGEKPWRDFHPIKRIAHRVLAFGRINSYKGVRFYPEIAERLLDTSPETTFVIAGKPSDDIDSGILDRLSKMPNVELHARFIEEGEIDGFFENCDLVLMPYTSITQSGVILDAYSRSRCVVAFDIDGIEQFVPEKRLRVSPYDLETYVSTLGTLLNDAEMLKAFSHRCWQFGRTNYSIEKATDSLMNVYEKASTLR